MRSTLITVPTTISRRTTTIIPRNTKTRIRTGSTTRNTGGMRSTGTRQLPRSTGSSVPAPEAGRPHPTPGVMAVVPVTGAVEGPRRATSAVGVTARVPVTGAAEGLRRATSVVGEAATMPWGVPEKGEASVLPATGARRAGALPRAALPAQGGRGAAAAVHRAAVEEPPGAAAVAGAAVAVAN